MIHVRLQSETFDPATEARALLPEDHSAGALVTFSGLCRDEGGRLTALLIEHYAGMAEAEIRRIAGTACRRWPLLAVRVVHRYGRILPGEPIVFVGTVSMHRADAFAASEFLMDYLKSEAPFWKREEGADGAWVAARTEDQKALKRW